MSTELNLLTGILVISFILGTALFFVGSWLIDALDWRSKAVARIDALDEKYEVHASLTTEAKCALITTHIKELEELENKTRNIREVHIYFSKRVALLVTLGLYQETI